MRLKYEIIVEIVEAEVEDYIALSDRYFNETANNLFLTASRQIGVKKVMSCEWKKIEP